MADNTGRNVAVAAGVAFLIWLLWPKGGSGNGSAGSAVVRVVGSTCFVGAAEVDCDSVPDRVANGVVIHVSEGSQGVVEDLLSRLDAAGISYTVED